MSSSFLTYSIALYYSNNGEKTREEKFLLYFKELPAIAEKEDFARFISYLGTIVK